MIKLKISYFKIHCWNLACACIVVTVVSEISHLDFTSEKWHGSELASYLMDNNKRISAVSPFACLSGMVDDDLFHGENINNVSYCFIRGRI